MRMISVKYMHMFASVCMCSLALDFTSNWAYSLSLSSNWPLDGLVSSCFQQKDTTHIQMQLSVDPKAPQSFPSAGWGPPGRSGLPPGFLLIYFAKQTMDSLLVSWLFL